MKNNDERKAYVRNTLNWKPIELTTYTVTHLLRYKGDEWIKISVLVEAEHWWDEELHTHNRRIVKELDEKGLYTVNADGDALVYTNETQIVNRMKELDKMYPDKKEGLTPNHLDIRRPGARVWPFETPEKEEEEE